MRKQQKDKVSFSDTTREWELIEIVNESRTYLPVARVQLLGIVVWRSLRAHIVKHTAIARENMKKSMMEYEKNSKNSFKMI